MSLREWWERYYTVYDVCVKLLPPDELIGHNNNVIAVSYRSVYYLTLSGTIRVVVCYSSVGIYVIFLKHKLSDTSKRLVYIMVMIITGHATYFITDDYLMVQSLFHEDY